MLAAADILWRGGRVYASSTLPGDSTERRELNLAGATVLRGPMGFGRSSHLHNAHILRLSLDLPIVVEIVDESEKIKAFLPELQKMMRGGLITLERAQVFHYS